jgi:hypothetical protein
MIINDESLLRKGPWKNEAEDFGEYKDAIREVLRDEPHDSIWNVQVQVRKSGNPIHQYRIILGPGS